MAEKQKVKLNELETIEKVVPYERDAKITDIFATAIGFTYELAVPADTQYGKILDNGSWTGLLGMLQRHEADIAISYLSVTEQRSKDFLFTFPYYCAEITYVTRQHKYSTDAFVFLKPFSLHVWIAIIACIFIMTCVLQFIVCKKNSPLNFFTFLVSSLLRQGINIQPENIREYLVLGFWFFCSSFFSFFYAAVLLSFLTFPSLEGIRTVKDLANGITAGEYHCKTYPGTFFGPVLLLSRDSSLQTIGKSLEKGEGARNLVEFLENETDSQPVFVGPRFFFLYYKDRYFISDDTFFNSYPALYTRKDFCCKAELDDAISRIWETGLIRKIFGDEVFKLFLKRQSRFKYDNHREVKLSMTLFMGPFTFLIASHVLAFIVFSLEICIWKLKFQNQKNFMSDTK